MPRLYNTAENGYGQLELNQVAFRRDGRIEAQCHLDETDFATVPAENGMLLAVDNTTRTIKFAVDDSFPIALNYTSEHMYDERANGLRHFKLERGSYLPRLGYLAVGDKFTTNCLSSTEYATVAEVKTALEEGTVVYGGASADGTIALSATKPTYGPVLLALVATTMPDGQFGIKFQTLSA